MALDLEKIQAKLRSIKQNKKTSDFVWKPTAGKHQIRILPNKYKGEDPFFECYFHYKLNGKTVISPVTNGKSDPIVDFANRLKATGNKEDWIAGRKLEPKLRTYVPIIVRGEEDKGVRLWGFGKTVYEQILNLMMDSDFGEIHDIKQGHDLVITITPATTEDGYPTTSIMPKPKKTSVTEDATQIKSWLENQPSIFDIYPEPTYDELKKTFTEWMNKKKNISDDDTTEFTKNSKSETKGTKPNTLATPGEVSDQFDDLFNTEEEAENTSKEIDE